MYDLPRHKDRDAKRVYEFIARYPFAFVTGCDAHHMPVATQIPVFVEEINGRQVLRGHIMKNMDHHKAFAQNPNVLVVFTGHHIYVSGTWYHNPQTASTWNYMSVHVQGMMHFLDDAGLIEVLRKTTLHFENGDTASSTIYDNLPETYTRNLLHMIVGFEIEIKKIDTVFKLSQDRDPVSYDNIIERLRDKGESGHVIADEMVIRRSEVFPSTSD